MKEPRPHDCYIYLRPSHTTPNQCMQVLLKQLFTSISCSKSSSSLSTSTVAHIPDIIFPHLLLACILLMAAVSTICTALIEGVYMRQKPLERCSILDDESHTMGAL